MTNAFSLFRSLIVYAICLPLAIIVGYLLATPTDFGSFVTVSLALLLLTIPLFLRWHYPWMVLCWNVSAIIFVLPGRPSFGMAMVCISFTISALQYIMNRQLKFISVPSITRPLLFILAIVVVTARLTGGIGFNVLGGGDNVGGKRYVTLFAAIIGFFALIAQRIPPAKARLYTNLYLMGSLTYGIANLATVVNPSFLFIFLIFPTDAEGIRALTNDTIGYQSSIARLGGLSAASATIVSIMLARYGIRGVFDLRKYWRLPIMLCMFVFCALGGYRSGVISLMLLCLILFVVEGLLHSRLLPILALTFILGAAVVLPFTEELPLSIQRSLAFLPIKIDPEAAISAKASSEWRLQMWANVLPLVPQYFFLGKGFSINIHEFEMVRQGLNKNEPAAAAVLAGDYHNGPLSLIITFGIFGVIGFVWFLVACFRALNKNVRYGDPSNLFINRFLLASFWMKTVLFFTIFGSFYSDMFFFTGIIGLSIALNGGICAPATEPAPVQQPIFSKFRLRDASQ